MEIFADFRSPWSICESRTPKSRFDTQNRASTLEIAFHHSESRPQHSKSQFNTRNHAPNSRDRAPTPGNALQHPETHFHTRKHTSNSRKHIPNTRKHTSSTRKHASSTRKHENYRILRLKLYGSPSSKRKLTNLDKIANFAHLFNSGPHQASAKLHAPQSLL